MKSIALLLIILSLCLPTAHSQADGADVVFRNGNVYTVNDSAPRAATYIHIGTDREAFSTTQLPINTWSFLTATYDGATLRLSVFYYYGTPLLHGLQAANVAVVVAVGAAALGLAALRFARKDISV